MKNTVIDKLLTEVEKAEKKNRQKQREIAPWLRICKFCLFCSLVVLFLLIFPVVLYLENKYLGDKLLLFLVAGGDLLFIFIFGLSSWSLFNKLPDPDPFDNVCERLKSYLISHYNGNESKVVELVMSEISKEREDAQKKFESIVKIMSLLPMLFFTSVIADFMKSFIDDKLTDASYRIVMLLFLVYLLSRGVGYIIVSFIKNPAFGNAYKKVCLYRYLSVVKYKVLENNNPTNEQ